ncbi:uncharacterized protein LOC123519084 [Portunus trituberculatus]|uniref:uncharacterized protein LOC123519084 n=1 Tax=Portunus trituberculatus TaxID=210409 RepID=UPI001E1CF631|nr:uncharacterized protein LOC123519084 [Portunus trituberculatus]
MNTPPHQLIDSLTNSSRSGMHFSWTVGSPEGEVLRPVRRPHPHARATPTAWRVTLSRCFRNFLVRICVDLRTFSPLRVCREKGSGKRYRRVRHEVFAGSLRLLASCSLILHAYLTRAPMRVQRQETSRKDTPIPSLMSGRLSGAGGRLTCSLDKAPLDTRNTAHRPSYVRGR